LGLLKAPGKVPVASKKMSQKRKKDRTIDLKKTVKKKQQKYEKRRK
jgi:hypothetical protein